MLKNAGKFPLQLGFKAFTTYYAALKKRDRTHRNIMRKTPHWRISWPSPAIYKPKTFEVMMETVISWAVAGIEVHIVKYLR
jgi:hypothetical protein